MLLRNRPGHVAAFLGVLLAGGTVVTINPSRGDERTRADIAALRLPLVVGEPDDLTTLVTPETRRSRFRACWTTPRRPRHTARDPGSPPGVAVRMLTSGTTGSAQANRPQLRHAGAQRDGSASQTTRRRPEGCAAASRSSTRPWCISAGYSGCCNASSRRDHLCCWNDSNSTHGPRRCASTAPARYRWCRPHCERCCTPMLPRADLESIRRSPAGRLRCRPTMPTPSPRSTAFPS